MELLEDRRLLAAIALDPNFGDTLNTPGYVITPHTPVGGAASVVIDPADGGMVVLKRGTVLRYNTDGALQWTAAAPFDGWNAAVLDVDGGILVVGTVFGPAYAAPGLPGGAVHDGPGSHNDFAIWRFNVNGTPDTTFGGGDGVVTVDFPSYYSGKKWTGSSWSSILPNTNDDYASAITIDQAGRIVVTGTSITYGHAHPEAVGKWTGWNALPFANPRNCLRIRGRSFEPRRNP